MSLHLFTKIVVVSFPVNELTRLEAFHLAVSRCHCLMRLDNIKEYGIILTKDVWEVPYHLPP